jgi:NAD(P)-dependent dehydrogenase (short-subunit alcohol dehydrogenase family)
LLARGEQRLRETAAGVGAEWEVCDVADRQSVEHVAAAVTERHGKVDLLVNNAGVAAGADFLSADPEAIERVTRINYLGAVWAFRAFLPALQAAAPSDVVNVTSVAAVTAYPPSGPYSATKAAQLTFSRATAAQLAGRGIRVHSVLPGFVETPGFPQRGRLPSLLVWTVVDPERVARAIVGLIGSSRGEVFIPWWYRPLRPIQGLFPSLVAWALARGNYRPAA